MIQSKTFYFNELRVCCYVLWDETKEAILIDPGCASASERERLKQFVDKEELKPKFMVNTHAHFDHVMGNAFVCAQWGIRAYLHPAEEYLLKSVDKYCRAFGIEVDTPPFDTLPVSEQEPLRFGCSQLQVLETPGHSPGGICLFAANERFLITGDTLFAGSIGRTDLPGGDYDQLIGGITQKIFPLGSPLRILPGHGPETTLDYEMLHNPFLASHTG